MTLATTCLLCSESIPSIPFIYIDTFKILATYLILSSTPDYLIGDVQGVDKEPTSSFSLGLNGPNTSRALAVSGNLSSGRLHWLQICHSTKCHCSTPERDSSDNPVASKAVYATCLQIRAGRAGVRGGLDATGFPSSPASGSEWLSMSRGGLFTSLCHGEAYEEPLAH